MNTFSPRAMYADCDSCPLNDKRPAEPTGPMDSPMIVVGDSPGKLDDLKGQQFVGPPGAKLTELLYKAGLDRAKVRVTSWILCRPEVPGVEGKRRYDLKVYVAWFRKQNLMRKKQGFPVQKAPWECCAPRLAFELAWAEHYAKQRGAPNGVVIVPLGNFALKGVSGGTETGGVLKYRGSVIPREDVLP